LDRFSDILDFNYARLCSYLHFYSVELSNDSGKIVMAGRVLLSPTVAYPILDIRETIQLRMNFGPVHWLLNPWFEQITKGR
jgi:hypothetical protein